MSKQQNVEKETQGQEPINGQQQFIIQRLYVKDLSFEAPEAPQVFKKEWKPEMHLDLNSNSHLLEENTYEVVLHLTVTVKSQNKVAFLVEVKQAGIFSIHGFNKEELSHALGSFCPSTLYPYAREVVTDVIMRGGFPQLILAPINFEALYAQQQNNEQEANGSIQ